MEETKKSTLGFKVPEELKKSETYKPNLPLAVSYCTLHQTTNSEDYRKLSLENVHSAESVFNFYNMLVSQKSAIRKSAKRIVSEVLDVDVDDVKRPINALTNLSPLDISQIEAWKTHCVNCKEPNEQCIAVRKGLEELDKKVYAGMTEYTAKALKILPKIFNA